MSGTRDTFQSADLAPFEPGWYECLATDDRWQGETRYRAWGQGRWWIPLVDGWLSSPMGLYRWRGPVADVHGPAPDGINPGDPSSFPATPPEPPAT
jgi:hypothetical protein